MSHSSNVRILTSKFLSATLIGAAVVAVCGLAVAQDKSGLKVPNGLSISEFAGYEKWEDVSVSETKTSVKAELGNPTMTSRPTEKGSGRQAANRSLMDPRS